MTESQVALDTATAASTPLFHFDNSYVHALSGCYRTWHASPAPRPTLLKFNRSLAAVLGLDANRLDGPEGAAIFAGNTVPAGAEPIVQAYAGHQFGGFSAQLGDGRALLLGEHIGPDGTRHDLMLKGSGRTPFSRNGDGKAGLGPVLREYLIGEALHALGVPTSRMLAAVSTGETILRDRPMPGAVVARVAASHLRVGTFQYFSARGETGVVRRLADYAIARHDPSLSSLERPYLAFLTAVRDRQAALIAQWLLVGFIHGVMNTDNMSIAGESLDFGPCAFLEHYDAQAVFSSIDHNGRYAFGNQPAIAAWNLARFAETLLPLLDADPDRAVTLATDVVQGMAARINSHWLTGMRAKLGLHKEDSDDDALARDFLDLLAQQTVDYTLACRRLADAAENNDAPLLSLFGDTAPMAAWLIQWRERLAGDDATSPAERAADIRRVSPLYIARNHQVEAALAAAIDAGDLGPFNALLDVLARPFEAQAGRERWAEPAPAEVTARYLTYCGT